MHIDEQTYLTLQTENIHFKIEISIQHYVITFVSDLRQVGVNIHVDDDSLNHLSICMQNSLQMQHPRGW
jgi:hypothetical protein